MRQRDALVFRGLAVGLWLNALWPLVLAAGAATQGDYGGLILMPPIAAISAGGGFLVWGCGSSRK